MTEGFEELVIDVRARTEGFASDLETMRRALDTSLLDGFGRAGDVLERGLLGAIRRGSLGFDDLKRIAFSALSEIAAFALQSGMASLFGSGGGGGAGGFGGLLGQTIGALFGLPGRATGGPVSPGRPILVGERGPEVFVPTSAGRIDNLPEAPKAPIMAQERAPVVFVRPPAVRIETSPAARPAQDVRVAIQLAVPRGQAAPTAMQRSARQIASAVRRSFEQA